MDTHTRSRTEAQGGPWESEGDVRIGVIALPRDGPLCRARRERHLVDHVDAVLEVNVLKAREDLPRR